MYVPRRARPEQRRPGLGHGRHTHRRSAPRLHGRAAAILPRAELSRHRLMFIAQAFAGHAEDHWINVVTSRAGGAFAEVSLLAAAPRGHALHAVPTRPENYFVPTRLHGFSVRVAFTRSARLYFTRPWKRAAPESRYAPPPSRAAARTSKESTRAPTLRPRSYVTRPYPRSSGRRASRATSWASSR